MGLNLASGVVTRLMRRRDSWAGALESSSVLCVDLKCNSCGI